MSAQDEISYLVVRVQALDEFHRLLTGSNTRDDEDRRRLAVLRQEALLRREDLIAQTFLWLSFRLQLNLVSLNQSAEIQDQWLGLSELTCPSVIIRIIRGLILSPVVFRLAARSWSGWMTFLVSVVPNLVNPLVGML